MFFVVQAPRILIVTVTPRKTGPATIAHTFAPARKPRVRRFTEFRRVRIS